MLVFDINVSHGSVATRLRCGGIFHNDFNANSPLSLSVKEFWKSVNIWRSYRQKYSGMFFFDSQCRSVILFLMNHLIKILNHTGGTNRDMLFRYRMDNSRVYYISSVWNMSQLEAEIICTHESYLLPNQITVSYTHLTLPTNREV